MRIHNASSTNQCLSLCFCGLAFLLLFQCRSQDIPDKPNIVIINIDDMGWRDTGFMGSKFYETPNLDSLAAMGMVFTNGYASAANCAPSRACLMTGLWTPRHGIYTVGSSERGQSQDRRLIPSANTTTLNLSHQTIASILQQEGYSTIHAGKWHLSKDPDSYGFDHNIGGAHNGHPSSYFFPFGNVDLPGNDGDHLTDKIMDQVVDHVHKTKSPFFLYYAPYAVHTPIQAIEHLKAKYDNKPSWQSQADTDYATMVENLDRNIGRLIQSLKEKGQFENTLLIFTSDNGGLYGITYQFPLRAGKGSYYEGGIRVPFLFVWKGIVAKQQTNETQITNLDLFPTLLEVIGVELEQYQYDGSSLYPMLTNSQPMAERPLFWHFPIYLQAYDVNNNQSRDPLFRTRPGSVIRMGHWKLHHYFEDEGLELYNLKDDVSEKKNLAGLNPAKVKELYTLLEAWRKEVDAPIPATANPEFEPQIQNGYNDSVTK